jgi:ABC-2 type transport system permease protein
MTNLAISSMTEDQRTDRRAASRVDRTRTAPLPSSGRLLVSQIGYQVKLLLSSGRAIAVGLGLPVILMIASHSKGSKPDVAGYAVFGLTLTAWNSYGVRLVTAREAGVLKRWWASPLPRWCYFLGAVLATAIVAVLAGAVTITTAFVLWGRHFGDGAGTTLTAGDAVVIVAMLSLGALAWAAAATAISSLIPSVEAAFPTLIFTYFPIIIISGVMFSVNDVHWLTTLASYLPAEPLIDGMTRMTHGLALPLHDILVLGGWAVGGLALAAVTFRWEPHRTQSRRAARPDAPTRPAAAAAGGGAGAGVASQPPVPAGAGQ